MTDAPRLVRPSPDALTAEQRALYDLIVGGRRSSGPQALSIADDEGRLVGPFNAMLLVPSLGHALQSLGVAVRYETTLSRREREIAVLVVAAVRDSDFERYAHETIGRRAGLSDAELLALRQPTLDEFADERERAVGHAAHALATTGDLSDAEYAVARDLLGESVIFELTTLVGYYSLLAVQLRVFRVEAPS